MRELRNAESIRAPNLLFPERIFYRMRIFDPELYLVLFLALQYKEEGWLTVGFTVDFRFTSGSRWSIEHPPTQRFKVFPASQPSIAFAHFRDRGWLCHRFERGGINGALTEAWLYFKDRCYTQCIHHVPLAAGIVLRLSRTRTSD